jgi:hypothetical protein
VILLTFYVHADAMQQYEELSRELTNLSRKMTTEGKIEEGAPDVFDLTDFLQNISQDRKSAGLKSKQLGLIWKNLTVKVCLMAKDVQRFMR